MAVLQQNSDSRTKDKIISLLDRFLVLDNNEQISLDDTIIKTCSTL
jgi:hypothetical protein